MYLEQSKTLYAQLNLKAAKPCTDWQLQEICVKFGGNLPASFEEFLLWMGQGSELMQGAEFYYPALRYLREDALRLLARNGFPEPLPSDAIVFWMYQDSQFAFMCRSDGNNPPIHYYNEAANKTYFSVQQFRSLDYFLALDILGQRIVKNVPKNRLMPVEQAELQTYYQTLARESSAKCSTKERLTFIGFDKLKTRYRQLGLLRVNPCTEEQVNLLENDLNMELPLAYREFLLWMGNYTGELFPDSEHEYHKLRSLNRWAKRILNEGNSSLELPDDAIVFWVAFNEAFCFLRLSEGDDPPVYAYKMGSNQFKRTHHYFSELLAEEIEKYA